MTGSPYEDTDVDELPIDPDVDPAEDARHRTRSARPARRWPRLHPALVAAVFVGGCVGGLGRYEVGRAWPTPAHGFPWAVLVVNVTGAFALAVLLVLVVDVLPPTTYLRPLLGTGLCGAWTTFSSVVADTDQLLAHGHAGTGVGYLVATVVGGLAAAAAGLAVGRAVALLRAPEAGGA